MPRKGRSTRKDPGKDSAGSRFAEWFDDRRRSAARRCLLWVALVSAGALAGVSGLRRLEDYILTDRPKARSVAARVALADRPPWMPQTLAAEIGNELLPDGADYRAADLTREVYEAAKAHPWIRKVEFACKVGRDAQDVGQVRVRATYRQPLAQVLGFDGYYRFVDTQGYVLPPMQVPRYVVYVPAREGEPARKLCYVSGADVPPDRRARAIHYVTVKGPQQASPGVGRRWPGEDLADALRLAKLISSRSYANQVAVIDCHKAPFLRMYAQVGEGKRTEIIFGRFPQPSGDYVLPVARKMAYLDKYVQENNGRLAGIHPCIDLRLDRLYVSSH